MTNDAGAALLDATDRPDADTQVADASVEPAETRRPLAASGTRIDIVSDAICPWCYIGKRQLERALVTLADEGLTFSVQWNPFQLNPDMPREGRDRAAYRAWKFGSAVRAAELDRRITDAAQGVGLVLRTDLMTRTPNTMDAHRLIWYAGQNNVQDAAMEAVFKAYFVQGHDIGDDAVLVDCAAEAGLNRAATSGFLAGDLAAPQIRAADRAAREAGVSGVPSLFLDGYNLFSGAMPAATTAETLRRARGILLRQQAATG